MTTGTKRKILDTAERLFASQGYSGTSLRSIISAAGVNLAAIHYHFKSKESLLDAVILRRAEAINRERLVLLEKCDCPAGGAPPLEQVLEAFLYPAFRFANGSRRGAMFAKLMARIHAEGDIFAQIIERHFATVAAKFVGALRRSLPDLPPEELFLRMHFIMGAMIQALAGPLVLVSLSGRVRLPDWETKAARLIEFVSAGLRAGVKK
jgi:AcrR family transcriptional regulator